MFSAVGDILIGDIRTAAFKSSQGDGALVAPLPVIDGTDTPPVFIVTPRPPTSVKESSFVAAGDAVGTSWVPVFQVAEYIPSPGSTDVRSARIVLSRMTAASVDGGTAVDIAVRVINARGGGLRLLLPSIQVPATGFLDLPLRSAIMDAQDVLQVRSLTSDEVHVTASYINVTREQFEVIP